MIYFAETVSLNTRVPLALHSFAINYLQEVIQRPEGLPMYQWFYCTKGQGELIINGQRSVVSAGQSFYIAADIPHSYRGLTKNWTVHLLGLVGDLCGEIMHSLGIHESGMYSISNPNLFQRYAKNIYQIYRSEQPEKELSYSKECFSFLLDLSQCIHHLSPDLPVKENSKVHAMITFIEEHYQENISLDDIAAHVSLTREYTCALFRKEMGQTLVRFLTGLRINRARILLCQYPEKRVLEIAHMCGFESPSYFGMVFKKEMGMTPEQFRSRH